jgi:hypothetical protein
MFPIGRYEVPEYDLRVTTFHNQFDNYMQVTGLITGE